MKPPRTREGSARPATARRRGTARRAAFSLVLLALVLIVLEGALRLPWLRERIGAAQSVGGFGAGGALFGSERLSGGGEILRIRAEATRTFHPIELRQPKPHGVARIFCLGGSSTFGYPWGEEVAFPAGIERRMRALLAGLPPAEVLNLGAMSYGSLRIRNLVRELVRYGPDLFVVYMGHNEFVEEEVYREILARGGWAVGAARALTHLRTYALLEMGAARLPLGPRVRALSFGLEGVDGIDVARAERKLFTTEEKREVVSAFRRNLEEIADTAERAGAGVLLLTVPSNLRDWPPEHLAYAYTPDPTRRDRLVRLMAAGRALLDHGNHAPAAAAFEQAIEMEPRYAPTHYDLARCYDALGRKAQAREHYGLARDLDPIPIRALSSINEAIRSVARERPRVLLADAEADFETASTDGVTGANLVLDYCHPNIRGHARIADLVVGTLAKGGHFAPRERWGIGGLEGLRFPEEAERPEAAEPHHVLWWLGTIAKRQGRTGEAIEKLELAVRANAAFAPGWKQLGHLRMKTGDLAGARESFDRAVALDPEDVEAGRLLAVLQRKEGDAGGSVASLRRIAESHPENPDLLSDLAESQRAAGDLRAAAESLRRALVLAPDAFQAWQSLGTVYMEMGENEEAIGAFRKAIEIVNFAPYAERMLSALEERQGGRGP